MIIMLMGVSGAGKTTVGRALAERLGWPFIEGDELHSGENRRKMTRGMPLTDDDRWPWLRAVYRELDAINARGGDAVVTCSALKESYREIFRKAGVRWVYLKAARRTLEDRLRHRSAHFFNTALLQSQLDILEEPSDAIVLAAEEPVRVLVRQAIDALGLKTRIDER